MPTAEEEKEQRGRTVPIHEWWSDAVRVALRKRGLNQKQLAEQLKAGADAVSRCINRVVPTLELVIAISDALAIPYPAIIPETEAEALHLATQRRLIRRDLQLSEIKAGVAEIPTESQTMQVPSEHAIRPRKRKRAGRVDARR